MKKHIAGLLFLYFLALSLKGHAQQVGSFWLNGGAGLSSNWIVNQNAYGNQEMKYAPSFGLTGGVGGNYFINREWGISAYVLLTQMGQNYSGVQAGALANRKVKLTYVELPFLIMRQITNSRFPIWIAAGPDLMILAKAVQHYSRDEGGSQLPNEAGMAEGEITERFKPVDIALNVSLNRMVEINYLKSLMIMFTLNSSLGLLDMNSAKWQIPNTHNTYQSSHNFYAGGKITLMLKVVRMGGFNW